MESGLLVGCENKNNTISATLLGNLALYDGDFEETVFAMKCHKVNMSLSKCIRKLRQRKAINNAHWLIIIWCHNCGKPISNSQAING